jgi:hypothetical protein
MAEGLVIRLTHAGQSTASVLVDDIADGTDGNGHTRKSGACYVPLGGAIDLVYSSSVAKSYEDGVIRGMISNGQIAAAFIIGDGLAEALGRTYRTTVAITANATTNAYIVVPSACKLVSITAFAAVAPDSAAGTYTLAVVKGPDAADTNMLGAATFDLESLAPLTAVNLTLSATSADLELAYNDVLRFQCTSDSNDLTGAGLQFVVVTS